ncbi:protein kinase [Streptomyces sp. NPDC005209]|uniref:serine/threonine-protein kinase n=1 Tax=Streptomyces sp. NPDC005209 TaxID=3156715 RepID=UPI0033B82FCD
MSDDGERTPEGRLLGGRYRLTERIGSGATGTVWRARDEAQGRDVAVKELRPAGDPEGEGHQRAAHRLVREARAAARVDHPAAVRVHEVVVEGCADGLPWIVMELIHGESLHTVLERGPLPPVEAARIGYAVLGALRAAHAVGIVHRDLKPANVLIESGTGRVVLTDFGIGHVEDDSPDARGFVAPERMSERGAGPASDLWSLGALLRAAVDPAGERPDPLGALLTRLLAEEPEARPGAAEVAAALEELAGGPAATRPLDHGAVRGAGPGADPASVSGAAPGRAPGTTSVPGPTSVSGPTLISASESERAPEPEPLSAAHPAPLPEPEVVPAPAPHASPCPPAAAPRRPLLTALGLLLPKKPGAGPSPADHPRTTP